MMEAVVERAELEAPAEEVFEHWAKLENFCAFVRSAEESRRVDLSGSSWLLKGPAGRSVEYEPEAFRRCLVGYRNRGRPCFVDVHQDASDNAWKDCLAVAKALGYTRSGALRVFMEHETYMDLLTELGSGP